MNLEIYSDLICPWCFIGKRRLDLALAAGAGEGVNVIWRAYQLYPGLPDAGIDRDEFLRLRFGSPDRAPSRTGIEAEARRVSIDMHYDRIRRVPNTFRGHRLLHHARSAGVQHELADGLFRAYFERGEDVGDDAVLLAVAEESGLDRAETARYLDSEAGADEVRAEMERAANIGISAVPCFLFAGVFALPGAQEPEVIAQVIERARERLASTA
ncbi:MAG: DsbA family oxidoreductase [Pseudomonadales bacterium]